MPLRHFQPLPTPDALHPLASGMTVEAVRAAAFDAAIAESNKSGPIVGVHSGLPMNPMRRASVMGHALSCRITGAAAPDEVREFMGMTIPQLAAACLSGAGVSTRGLNNDQLITRAMHSTSDFPALLQAAGSRVLLNAFEPAASRLRRIARSREAQDFRPLSAIRAAGVDRLLELNEGGEVKSGTAFEASETYRVRTFARVLRISRAALINDDLGAFDALRSIGRAAAVTEAAEFMALLNANAGAGPTLADTFPLFRTQRNNLAAAGAALDVTTVGAGRAAMRVQTDLNGVMVSSEPRILLVGPALETAAEQLLATLSPVQLSGANPFGNGRLELSVEPRLSGSAWYLFADPTLAPVFEFATLVGTGGAPTIEVFTESEFLGVTIRAVHDFGIGAVSPIGCWRNPGT